MALTTVTAHVRPIPSPLVVCLHRLLGRLHHSRMVILGTTRHTLRTACPTTRALPARGAARVVCCGCPHVCCAPADTKPGGPSLHTLTGTPILHPTHSTLTLPLPLPRTQHPTGESPWVFVACACLWWVALRCVACSRILPWPAVRHLHLRTAAHLWLRLRCPHPARRLLAPRWVDLRHPARTQGCLPPFWQPNEAPRWQAAVVVELRRRPVWAPTSRAALRQPRRQARKAAAQPKPHPRRAARQHQPAPNHPRLLVRRHRSARARSLDPRKVRCSWVCGKCPTL